MADERGALPAAEKRVLENNVYSSLQTQVLFIYL